MISGQTAVAHFGAGRHGRSFAVREPAGVIVQYRISAPAGVRVRAWAQIPHVTVPLAIRTAPDGPSSSCARRGSRVVCTQGEEGCPMPPATWHFRVVKLTGRAGSVVVRFRVGRPPKTGAG